MVLSGCAAVQPPQLIKEPARGERIDISRLNVAIFPPNIRPPGGSQVAGAEGMLPLIGPASVEVRSELINQLPQLLANANMAVESKKIYSTPGRNVDLPAEFSNANAGTFFLTVFEVGSKAVCPIFFGNCGISTKYQVNLARAGEQALWSALFVFDTGALSSVNAEYVRVNLITPIAQEVIRVSQSK